MEQRPLPVRLVAADELGILKVAQSADGAQLGGTALVDKWGAPDRSRAIDCIALGSAGGIEDTASAMLAVARASGAIELLSPLTGELRGTIAPTAASSSSGDRNDAAEASQIGGLHLLWGEAAGSSGLPAVLSVTRGGAARLHAPPLPAEGGGGKGVEGGGSWRELRAWATPPQVCCTALDAGGATLAVGCQGAELRLYDVSTGTLTWAAKGGKPNMVGLVDRPWNTAVAFLPPPPAASADGADGAAAASGGGGGDGGGGGNGPCHRVLVGTGHHKLRLYNSSIGKRPQADLPWGEARITALAVEPGGQRCWVANGAGLLECLDLRSRRCVGAIKGAAGSIRALALHPSLPLLASVGLDRRLRLHSTASRACLAKLYLKTQLSCVAFCPTDASMLPPPPAPTEAGGGGREQGRRRKGEKRQRGGQGAAEKAAARSSEGQQQRQQHKSNGKKKHRQSQEQSDE